jgi:hypothetical protein
MATIAMPAISHWLGNRIAPCAGMLAMGSARVTKANAGHVRLMGFCGNLCFLRA